jgi:hypothetical protein
MNNHLFSITNFQTLVLLGRGKGSGFARKGPITRDMTHADQSLNGV